MRGRFACTNRLSMQRNDALKDVKLRTGLLLGWATCFASGALKVAQADSPIRVAINRQLLVKNELCKFQT
jgi:hypothetical protein